MKNIYKYLFVGLLFTVFTSCDKEGLIVFDTPDGFVQLGGSPATSIGEESGSPVATRVELGMSNPDGISVVFTTQSADDSRYQVLTASPLNIPAGQTFAEILIQPVDNFDVDGNIDVTLALVSADAPIGLAGDGLERVSRTITIIDNDCPITIEDWVGTYDVSENFTDGGNAPLGLSDFFGEAYQVELSLDPDDISGSKVVINNSDGFNVYINDGTIMSFDTCNGGIIFDAGFPLIALWNVYEYSASTYDEDALSLQCSGPFLNFGPYQFTFTKQ